MFRRRDCMDGILAILMESSEFKMMSKSISSGTGDGIIQGLSGSQKSYIIAGLHKAVSRPIALVTYSLQQAEKILVDLHTFLAPQEAVIFPPLELLPHEEARESPDILYERLRVQQLLAEGENPVVIIPIRSLVRKLIPGEVFKCHVLHLHPSMAMDFDQLVNRLVFCGFERVGMVEQRGQMSVRGGIVDVFPVTAERPIRIEFFGDEIESIREFDAATQVTISHLDVAAIPPAREFLLDMPDDEKKKCLGRIRAELDQTCGKLAGMGLSERSRDLAARVEAHLEKLTLGMYFDSDEQYAPFFYPNMGSLLDRMNDPLLILDEPGRIREGLSGVFKESQESYFSLLEKGTILPSQAHIFYQSDEITGLLGRYQTIHITFMSKGMDIYEGRRIWNFPARMGEAFNGNVEMMTKGLSAWRRKAYRIVFCISAPTRARALLDTLKQAGIPAIFEERPKESVKPGNVVITSGELENGFEFPSLRLVVLTDTEIYGATRKKRRIAPKSEDVSPLSSYTSLTPGDYVVHINHGIGKYLGIQTLEVAGVKKDYLVVKYAGEDRLYVPTDQVNLLQKYIGLDDMPPKIYKLGGSEWAKVKNRVRETVKDVANKLIELYSVREASKGHAFSPDTIWQKEFEEAFPYEETPDQWRAIEEVKRDMESPRPMDRLLCGDVGYGKTEIAIRAAFKCVMDSKQVAVLVPTTILAQQHYMTFKDRFQGFPVEIAVLSRFQSAREQQEILKKLKHGEIDIIIGTHRLLQKDVRFKDLGLLVVDEEQRFGVMHKEALKELKKNVDVLTLTATPIPRTLHMSLVSIRDMSLIQTPPENRLPVRTYVMEYDDSIIRDAITREIDRGGQVYFVHNRIQSIESCASRLAELVPEARIKVAHGQMPEDLLESTMLQFLDREFDVLVCTTIIENGLDIPNVNTIIVEDAANLGLAQLYQLRGRVGRSNRVAYAYFMYQRDHILTEESEKRLQAIKEFTDLGSGFKIAMRDLEIRGAGNILGAEQHGHIAAVGFELYAKLMRDSIKELRGEKPDEETPDPVIELPVSAFIPDDYIPDGRQKIEMYKKINRVTDAEEADALAEEFIDRFGDIPQPARNLLMVAKIKAICKAVKVVSVTAERDGVTVRLSPFAKVSGEDLMSVVRQHRGRVKADFARSPSLKLRVGGLQDGELLSFIESCISGIGARTRAVSGE